MYDPPRRLHRPTPMEILTVVERATRSARTWREHCEMNRHYVTEGWECNEGGISDSSLTTPKLAHRRQPRHWLRDFRGRFLCIKSRTPLREMCSYVENPLNRGLHPLPVLPSFLLPLSPIYSILFIPAGPLTANSFPPTLFLHYSSSVFCSCFTRFSLFLDPLPSAFTYVCFLFSFILFSCSPSLCLSSYSSSSRDGNKLDCLAR